MPPDANRPQETRLSGMVRPDETNDVELNRAEVSRFDDPAGARPVQSETGTTGSRLQSRGEIHAATAERHKPWTQHELFTGEQARGRQHEVKPAASTEKQWESRAAHVTAKATSESASTGQSSATDLLGVRGVARVQGSTRNRRDPSALPWSGQGASHKPKAKASAAQRKSEGVVVPSMTVTNNAVGGKDLCFGHADSEGKREGMVGSLRPKIPFDDNVEDKVRQLHCQLRLRAKRRACGFPTTDELLWSDNHKSPRRARRLVVHARTRGPSASRVRENRKHGLTGGPESSSSTTHVLRK